MIFFSDGNDEDGGWENFTIIDITTTKAQPIRFVREVSGKSDKSMLMLGNSTPYNCNYQFPTKISLLPGEKFEMNVVNNSLVREMEFYVYIYYLLVKVVMWHLRESLWWGYIKFSYVLVWKPWNVNIENILRFIFHNLSPSVWKCHQICKKFRKNFLTTLGVTPFWLIFNFINLSFNGCWILYRDLKRRNCY